jgi:hypothetical protein
LPAYRLIRTSILNRRRYSICLLNLVPAAFTSNDVFDHQLESEGATDNNRIGEDDLLRKTAFKGIVGFADVGRVELREIKDGQLKNSGIYKGAPSWAIYTRY